MCVETWEVDVDTEGRFGEDFDVVVGDELPDRPRVVDEAHEVLTTYSRQLAGTGAAGVVGWVASGLLGLSIPDPWLLVLLVMLLALCLLYLVPVTREPRLAREVLKRWDRLRVDRALESSGITGDPRIEVAESMAERVVRHPSVDSRVRDAASTLLVRLRMALRDLRRVQYLTEARATLDQDEGSRSISDLHDLLEARVTELLGQLAELHSTVVLRDAASVARVMDRVDELVHELEAERDVERLLTDAESR